MYAHMHVVMRACMISIYAMYMCTHVYPVGIWMVGIKEAPMFTKNPGA